jgi:hypothetical protein
MSNTTPTQNRASTWMSFQDVLVELGVSRSTLNKWRAEGRGPGFKKLPNGELRIRRVDLDTWVASLQEVA